MSEIRVYWERVGSDGWAKVNGIDHRPEKVTPPDGAQHRLITPGVPPALREGWYAALWINPELGTYEYRPTMNTEFRLPAGEVLASLPVQTRVGAKALADTDPVLKDFLELLDMMAIDSACKGLHPGSEMMKVGLGYLVHLELMTQEQADALTTPFAE